MADPQLSVNSDRFDTYKNFKFRIQLDGKYVAGFSKISALNPSTVSEDPREGGDPSTVRKQPATMKFEAITLERGVTHDPAFEHWAMKTWNTSAEDESNPLTDFRKDLIIELLDEYGHVALAYKVYRCWTSEYQGMGEPDAKGKATLIEKLVLQNEGWERDENVRTPA